MTTSERSVEEIVEGYKKKFALCNEVGRCDCDKEIKWLTKVLQIERQKREEVVELERHKIKLRIDYDRRKNIPAEETVQDIYDSIELKESNHQVV
jgi:hypothetical protein